MANIIFIVPQLSQPRCIKRIESFRQAGFSVKIYGFDNGLYSSNIHQAGFKIEKTYSRNKLDNKAQKVLLFIKTIKSIVKSNDNNDIYYCFGFELGCVMRFFGCRKYIYEEADIVSAYMGVSAIAKKFFYYADQMVIRRSIVTVLTSGGFVKYLFKKKTYPANVIVQPNRLNPYFINKDNLREVHGFDINHLRFSFIGLIRFPDTIIRFANIIGKYYQQHEFNFYGDMERNEYVNEELKHYSNIIFHGAFNNPSGLYDIYRKTDINIVCYDAASENVRVAEPNKLYESVYFLSPIVVSNNTYLSQKVQQWGVGFSINSKSDDDIRQFIDGLNIADINDKIQHCKSMASSELIDDATQLINIVKDKFSYYA